MLVIKPYTEILTELDNEVFLATIERAARTCYKSEDRISPGSAAKLVDKLMKSGHHAMIEHAPSISVKFICDRGVSHEIVRHRLFSFAQESTRYCNYGKDNNISFIEPCFWRNKEHDDKYCMLVWESAMQTAVNAYYTLIQAGASPQEARSVLPNSLKTELIVTGNVREWRHFFALRIAKTAHPQMRELAIPLLEQFILKLPLLFGDLRSEGVL